MEFKGKLVHKRQDTIIVHQMQVIKEVLAQNHPEERSSNGSFSGTSKPVFLVAQMII